MSTEGEFVGGRPARDTEVLVEAADEEAMAIAARLLPHNYYLSGEAQARLEIFIRRGHLTRELTALGLPPVYEHATGVLVGKQVDTSQPAAGGPNIHGTDPRHRNQQQQQQQKQRQEQDRPWRRLRQQVLNPAHNPVMARNIRMKAQLAKYAARGAAAVAQAAKPSGRVLRYNAAMDEAERTTAKLKVVGAGAARRMGSAPVSKPYHPRRLKGGVPANETEGGDLMPGKLSRLMADQIAAEEEEEEEEAAARARAAGMGPAGGLSATERKRQEQIQMLADVIVAAPKLGIHELGTHPRRRAPLHPRPAAGTARPLHPGGDEGDDDGGWGWDQEPTARSGGDTDRAANWGQWRGGPMGQEAGRRGPARGSEGYMAAGLAEALKQLELSAAAGREVVAAAEDDYGAHYTAAGTTVRGPSEGGAPGSGGDEEGDGDHSPVASSYGSGGHYLHEEGMAEESDGGDSAGSGGSEEERRGSAQRSSTAGDSSQQQPAEVTVQSDPMTGIRVVLYPAPNAAQRRRRQFGSPWDGGGVPGPPSGTRPGPSLPYDPEAMRRWDAPLPNEAAGGRTRRAPGAPASSSQAPPSPRAAGSTEDVQADQQQHPEREHPSGAGHAASASGGAGSAGALEPAVPPPPPPGYAPAAVLRVPNEIRHTGRVRLRDQPESAGMDVSGRWVESALAAGRPAGATRRRGHGSSGRQGVQGQQQDSLGGRMADPAWRRESHAERAEALVAAAETRAREEEEAAAVARAAEAAAMPRIAARIGGGGGARPPRAAGAGAGAGSGAYGPPDGGGGGSEDGLSLDRFALLSDNEEPPEEEDEDVGEEKMEGTAGVHAAAAAAEVDAERLQQAAAEDEAEGSGAPGDTEGIHLPESEVGLDTEGAPGNVAGQAPRRPHPDVCERQQQQQVQVQVQVQVQDPGLQEQGWRRHVARVEWADSSSEEEGDPWGIQAADEMGYPLSFRRAAGEAEPSTSTPQRSTTAAAAVNTTITTTTTTVLHTRLAVSDPRQRSGTRGTSSNATEWAGRGEDDGPASTTVQPPAPDAGHRGVRVQAGRSGTRSTTSFQAAAHTQKDLLKVFGLVREAEVVIDPRDIAPIHLAPPPKWLVGPASPSRGGQGGEREQAESKNENVRQDGGTGAAGARSTTEGHGGRRPAGRVGRVEAALARAEERRPPTRVKHDKSTFYFTEHPWNADR